MRVTHSSVRVFAVVILALLGVPRTARATRSCAADTDCPRGFECERPPGVCVSLECRTDSDCGTALRCQPNGTVCVTTPAGQQDCHPSQACGPQWQAPCTQDTDCGPGFTCSGSSGIVECGPSADAAVPSYATSMRIPCADVPRPPLPPSCQWDGGGAGCPIKVPQICKSGSTCQSVSWKLCEQTATPSSCSADPDCPPTWTCACSPNPARGTFIPADQDATPQNGACEKQCVPPNNDIQNGGVGPVYNGGPSATVEGVPSTNGGSAPEQTPDAGVDDATGKARTTASSSGCSVVNGSSTGNGCRLAFVAAAAASARLRRRSRIKRLPL